MPAAVVARILGADVTNIKIVELPRCFWQTLYKGGSRAKYLASITVTTQNKMHRPWLSITGWQVSFARVRIFARANLSQNELLIFTHTTHTEL